MEKNIQIYFHHHVFFWGGGGENIFKFIFTTIFKGGGGENIFKFIFSTVFLVEKINLNLFSLPFIVLDFSESAKSVANQ